MFLWNITSKLFCRQLLRSMQISSIGKYIQGRSSIDSVAICQIRLPHAYERACQDGDDVWAGPSVLAMINDSLCCDCCQSNGIMRTEESSIKYAARSKTRTNSINISGGSTINKTATFPLLHRPAGRIFLSMAIKRGFKASLCPWLGIVIAPMGGWPRGRRGSPRSPFH